MKTNDEINKQKQKVYKEKIVPLRLTEEDVYINSPKH